MGAAARRTPPPTSNAEVLRWVRHHHERLDGSGYPDGLAGEAISLPMWILAVANVFDALASARPYEPAHPPATCLRILEDEIARGWWDDADVVAAVARIAGA